MVEVTGFNILDSQILGAVVLIDSNGRICTEDIWNIDVIDLHILDNAKEKRLAWKKLILLYKFVISSIQFIIAVFNDNQVSSCS